MTYDGLTFLHVVVPPWPVAALRARPPLPPCEIPFAKIPTPSRGRRGGLRVRCQGSYRRVTPRHFRYFTTIYTL